MTQVLRMPQSQRALFEVLALYDPAEGLHALLARIHTGDVSQREIYHAAHRRLPDGLDGALNPERHPVARQLESAVLSEEFHRNVVLNLQHAFPELRRDILLRLPGQESPALMAELAGTHTILADRLGAAPSAFLPALSHLVRSIRLGGDLLVDAAVDLERLVARAEPRPQDRLFVMIDDPIVLLVAQANHAIAQLRADPQGLQPANRDVLRRLGQPSLNPAASAGEWRMLTERALSDPQICPPNPICTSLSHIATKSAAAALLAAVLLDIEITTVADQPAWLLERWGLVVPATPVPTMPFLTVQQAQELFPDLLEQATAQDRRVYDVVTWALAETGGTSVKGAELARLGGHRLLADLPDAISAERGRAPGAVDRSRKAVSDPIEALGETGSHNHLATIATARALGDLAGPWIEFGAAGNSDSTRRIGWSVAEEQSCWTRGPLATLQLDRPQPEAAYRLLLDATPFVAAHRLPRQRLGIQVNGHAVAICAVSERFVLEVPLPWSLLQLEPAITIELLLPDATAPRDTGAGDDDRRLGLYVRSLGLLRAAEPAPAPPSPPAPIDLAEPGLKDLALQFESIGENCEFGLVQRRWGAEPLGLLRFASSPLDKLLAAMRNRFREMGGPEMLEVQLGSGQEYMVLDRKYGFLYHAWAKVGELTPEQILTREHRRVPFLIRKLTEELQAGEKLFVYHGMQPLIASQVRALSSALRLYGPSKLLWMELADAAHPPGTVQWIDAHVIKGHMDRFAPGENAHDISLECWEKVCRAAWRLWRSTSS